MVKKPNPATKLKQYCKLNPAAGVLRDVQCLQTDNRIALTQWSVNVQSCPRKDASLEPHNNAGDVILAVSVQRFLY